MTRLEFSIGKLVCILVPLVAVAIGDYGCVNGIQSFLNKGNRLFSEGKYEEAAINYRNVIKRDGRSGEAYYRLGLTELKLGRTATAYDEFSKATQFAPGRDDIRAAFADCALDVYRANPKKQKSLYEQIASASAYFLKNQPNSFDGLRFRGDLLSIDGRFDEAIEVFKQANAVKPLEPSVVMPWLQVLFRLRRSEAGEDLARKFFEVHKDFGPAYDVLFLHYMQGNRVPEAENLLKLKAAAMPKDSGPLLQLASLYAQSRREGDMDQIMQRILSDSTAFPNGHAIVGDFYAQLGRWDDAIRQYNAGMLSSSGDRVGYQKLIIKALIAQGKREDAIGQLNKVLQAKADDLDSRTTRAILLRDSKDPKRLDFAISELNTVIGKIPNDPIVRYNLGIAYKAKGDLNAARTQLIEAARLQSTYVPPRLALAEMAQRARNYSETVRWADEVLTVEDANSSAKLWRCAGLIGLKDYKVARTELDALLRQLPNSIDVNLHMAVLDTIEKKYADAESRYKRLYEPGREDLRPLEGLIQLYAVQHQPQKSLILLDRELKKAPESRPVHLLLASTAASAGRLDLATQQYAWLINNDPKSPEVFTSLGDLYQMEGDVSSALENYRKARELAPNDPKAIGMMGYLQSVAGQQKEAVATLRQKLRLRPDDAETMNNLAYALAETDTDLDEALTLAERAQKQVPNNPGIEDTLAWIYTKKGLNDSAIQIFNGLVKKYPDEPAFRYHLGVALLQKGQTQRAKDQFIISLSKKPSKEMADKINQLISKIS